MLQLNKLIYENLFEKAIAKEGGNAVEGVDRIQKENVEPTFKQIKEQIIYPLYGKDVDIFLLGSTGKKPSSRRYRYWN